MKRLRYICLLLIFIFLAGSVRPVAAQDYRFQVPSEAAIVTINKDGTISIDYTISFTNDSSAHAIDIVDIGMPNSDYVLSSITAKVGDKAITKITKSDYVDPGISVYLLDNEIPAGGSGTITVHVGTVKNVIYAATETESESYGSFKFSPNWFDSQYCYGNTNLQVTFLLPAGLKTTETRYYTPEGGWPGPQEPESKLQDNGSIFYTWVSDQANAYTQYTFGASFPARVLADNAIITAPYVPPSSSSSSSSSGSSFDISSLCPWLFCLGFLGFFALIIYSATIGAKKRKLQYLPPKISIEGHGIKRGLTAIEAGVLMEQPMDKLMTMILFGLLKKNAAEVITKEPLAIKAANPLPADLYGYETDFLAAFSTTNALEKRKLLQTMMVNLIKSVGEKMKGFSQKETVAFYQDIMNRAWQQVEQAATPEVKGQVYDDVMDWTMLDHNYETRTQQTFSGPIFIPTPIWWWRYDPSFPRTSSIPMASTSAASVPSLSSGGGKISLPSLPGSAFAASVVGSVQNFSSNVLGGVTNFTSGVTSVTNPPPPPSTYRSSGGGGGHACACACACAGCACACAGGGR